MLEQIPDTLAARGPHDNAPSLLLVEEEDHDVDHHAHDFSHSETVFCWASTNLYLMREAKRSPVGADTSDYQSC